MEYEDAKNLAELLVKRALAGERSEFQFIRRLGELGAAIRKKRAVKKVAANFRKSAKRLLKSHLRAIRSGEWKIELLLAYKQMLLCADFYSEEATTLKDMIAEYRCYLRYGHFLPTLAFDLERPEEDCVDWREVPLSW